MSADSTRAKPKPKRTSRRLKRRACLRCDREFLSEGPHNRLCNVCREFLATSPTPVEESTLRFRIYN